MKTLGKNTQLITKCNKLLIATVTGTPGTEDKFHHQKLLVSTKTT